MRYLLPLLLILSFVVTPAPALAQQSTPTPPTDAVTKSVCASTFAYANLETLKSALLAEAKRAAVNELYGEFISALTKVENFTVTSDQIRSLTFGFVRVWGNEKYDNGPNLAEVCVTLTAYTTAEERANFQPVAVGKRACITQPNLSVAETRRYAQEEVLAQALIEYDRRLADTARETLLRLLRRVVYTESGFLAGSDSYCAAAQGEVTPVEVLALLDGGGTAVAISQPTPAPATPAPTRLPTRLPTRQATATPTPVPNRTLSAPQMTATASMATVVAFQSRTATPTPTYTATPNRTATAQASAEAATATAVSVTAQAIAAEEAATATAIAGVAQAIATAQAQGLDLADIAIGPVDGGVYVYIPEGEFARGDANGGSNEKPVKTIFVSGFWLKQTEVTNAEYGRCVAGGKCSAPNNNSWQQSQYANHPVTDVDWSQAVAYATWAGGRLPTEAEWERACRGDDGRSYPWGNATPSSSTANFGDSSRGTTAVGSYPAGASPYGLLDMAGNVWEWTADWYDAGYYASAPQRDPTGPSSGSGRVLRGGSFVYNATDVRCANRGWFFPDVRLVNVGFRVVLPPGF